MEGRNYEAVTLLERYLKDWADDSLHVKLAQVFAATNMMQDSLSHYQAALRYICSALVVSICTFESVRYGFVLCETLENT